MKPFENSIQRKFILGDQWLYYKLYTGSKTSDIILAEAILPVASDLYEKGIIDQWFFIRYSDPKHHLRIRFRCAKQEHIQELISQISSFLKPYITQDLIWKVQLDTYQRELERYGTNTMELSEELFFHDSTMIATFVGLIEGDEGEELRWLFALRAIDKMLTDFKYDDDAKLELLENLKTAFGIEFNMTRELKKQLDDKYRKHRQKIIEFMNFTAKSNPDLLALLELIESKSSQLKESTTKILDYLHKNKLEMPLNDLMSSYIHMLMNRLFKSNNRKHEMVCYDFLYRYYKSEWAKNKYTYKT